MSTFLSSKLLLSTIWNDPWKRLVTSVGLAATYLVIVACLRFQRFRSMQRQYRRYGRREDMEKMTIHDAWAIQKHILQLEFPTAALKSLQFALFRVGHLSLDLEALTDGDCRPMAS